MVDWISLLLVGLFIWVLIDYWRLLRHQSRTPLSPQQETEEVLGHHLPNDGSDRLSAYRRLTLYGYYGHPPVSRIVLVIALVVGIGLISKLLGS